MSKPRVYRMEEIPEGVPKEDVQGYFSAGCRSHIEVVSLATAADGNERNRTQTATILFRPTETRSSPVLTNSSVQLDSDFNGFTPLYNPDGAVTADIIAVNGLAGHAFGSWAVSPSRMWLRDFLPYDLSQCRIMTYGYDSQLGADDSRSIVFDHSNNFLVKLQDMRDQARCVNRPLVLIGHSLGGLIVKDALVRSHSFPERSDVAKISPICCIIFIGTPHHGIDMGSMPSLVRERPSEELVRELKKGSPTLTRLNMDFKHLFGDFPILTLYEMKKTPSVRELKDGSWDKNGPAIMMVENDSAILYWKGETTIGLNQHHREIAKIERGQNGCYNQVRGFIQQSLRPGTVRQSIDTAGLVYSSTDPYRHNTRIDNFFVAVRGSAIRGVQNEIDNGMDVNAHKGDHHTALHVAAEWATVDDIFVLIDNGADLSTYDRDGWTPFHFACRFNSVASVMLFLRSGADPNIPTKVDRCTPLHLAARYNKSLGVVRALIDAGAIVDAEEVDLWTPLHLAVRNGNRIETIDLLLRSGASVNNSTGEGYTPLHLAARHLSTKVVDLLLGAGASIDARDGAGWTPLHWAVRFGRTSSVEALLRVGADPRARSIAGVTPAEIGFDDIVSKEDQEILRARLHSPAISSPTPRLLLEN